MKITIECGEDTPLATLLADATVAWNDWQSRLSRAGEDPAPSRSFAEEAAQLWLQVERAAANLGLALVARRCMTVVPSEERGEAVEEHAEEGDEQHAEEAEEQAAEEQHTEEEAAEEQAEEVEAQSQEVSTDLTVATADGALPGESGVDLEPATLQQLEDSLNGRRFVAKPDGSESALARLRKAVGRTPARPLDRMLFRGQIKTLPSTAKWHLLESLSADERHLALTWLAARVRRLQAYAKSVPNAPMGAISELVRTLMRALDLGATRHVHGLARRHEPIGDSWLHDALEAEAKIDRRVGRTAPSAAPEERAVASRVDDAFRRLRSVAAEDDTAVLLNVVDELLVLGVPEGDVRWIGPLQARLDEVAGTVGRDRVRRAVERASDKPKTHEFKAPKWHMSTLTRGKRAVILGGDGRHERTEKLREYFDFASLDWPDLPQRAPRAVKSVVAQLKSGKYDIAIVLQQFISHAVTDQVFGVNTDGLKVVLARGYGVGQLEKGLERFLGSDDDV